MIKEQLLFEGFIATSLSGRDVKAWNLRGVMCAKCQKRSMGLPSLSALTNSSPAGKRRDLGLLPCSAHYYHLQEAGIKHLHSLLLECRNTGEQISDSAFNSGKLISLERDPEEQWH